MKSSSSYSLNAKIYSVALCAFVRRNLRHSGGGKQTTDLRRLHLPKNRDLRLRCFHFRTNAGQRASKPMNGLAAHVIPAQKSRKEAAAARGEALRERMGMK
jgi:hypothetical protein